MNLSSLFSRTVKNKIPCSCLWSKKCPAVINSLAVSEYTTASLSSFLQNGFKIITMTIRSREKNERSVQFPLKSKETIVLLGNITQFGQSGQDHATIHCKIDTNILTILQNLSMGTEQKDLGNITKKSSPCNG